MSLRPRPASRLCAALAVSLAAAASAQAARAPITDDDSDILAPLEPETKAPQSDKDKGKGKEPDPSAGREPVEPQASEAPTPAKDAPARLQVGLAPLIAVGDTSPATSAETTKAVRTVLGEVEGIGWSELSLPVGTATGVAIDEAAAKKALEDGAQAYDRGRKLLDKVQLGKAKKAIEQAIASYEAGAGQLAEVKPLVECHVALAEIAARQGQDALAEQALRRVAALDPEFKLDDKKFPPLFVRTHQKARDQMWKGPRAGLFIDESSAGAKVEVDGRSAGTAPVHVTELLPGRHVVRVLRNGLPSWGTIVDAPAEGEATVTSGLVAKDAHGPSEELGQNKLTVEAARTVARTASAAGLAGAVVGVVSKTGERVTIQLIYVDASGQGVAQLPLAKVQADFLDIGIETLKAREALEAATASTKGLKAADLTALVPGVKGAAELEVGKHAMKYDVRVSATREKARVVTDDGKEPSDEEGEDGRVVASGKSGTSVRLDDEEDTFASRTVPDDEAVEKPLTEQGWFWPTVIGGGVVGAVALGAGVVGTLVILKVLPDPRAAGSGEVHVNVPAALP